MKPQIKIDEKKNFIIHFSFDTVGAKEKFPKENAVLGDFALCGGRGGLRDLHRAAF